MLTVEQIIAALNLKPHPEGGFYIESYRSEEKFLPPGYTSERNFSTAIYYLLLEESFSAFHRLHSDEALHFYSGSPVTVHEIDPHGNYSYTNLGNDISAGQRFQHVVKAGHWFASQTAGPYSLIGCTVSPGFDFRDFELAERQRLAELFPQHEDIIRRLTRS